MSDDLLLDGRTLSGLSGVRGIGTYTRGLVEGLCEAGAGDRVVLLRRPADPLPADLAARGVREGPAVLVTKRRLQPLLDPLLVAAAVRRARPAVYHGLEWAQPLVAPGTAVVVTVHDLIPWLRGHHYRWQRRERTPALRQLRRAQAVIVPSHSTAQEVGSLARVRAERIHVVPHGVASAFRPAAAEAVSAVRTRLGLERPFVLVAGTQEPRKRLDIAVASVEAARRRGLDIDLVVAGDQAKYAGAVLAAVRAVDGHVVGHLPLADLVALYTGAVALLFTSEHEGFGLPVLEAMACGCPVVAVDATATAEAAGGAALLAPPGDVAGLGDALVAAAGERRPDLVARGLQRASAMTWRASAAGHLEVYATARERLRAAR